MTDQLSKDVQGGELRRDRPASHAEHSANGALASGATGSHAGHRRTGWWYATGSWLAETGPIAEAFSGPPTSAQHMALRQLQYVADVQESAVTTALKPLRKGPPAAFGALRKNWLRVLFFVLNGLTVFLVGIALQIELIRHAGMSHVTSYVIQTIVSVQLNFALSRYLTWRDRSSPFMGALIRFNLQQLATTGIGMAAYAGLDRFGMNYIVANVAVTAVLTPASFTLSHFWSLRDRAERESSTAKIPWPLLAVLVVQILLSLRLIWTNTAFIDEATYLYSGSQELIHWLHGVPVNDYQDYLSGAPVVYPPLAALANAVGGLVGARLLALSFMLATTSLLYFTTRRLFGTPAALLGSALFACLGATQFLSAFATYDPMALFLLALSAYLVIGRAQCYDNLTDVAYSTVIAGGALALANADKYATALWDPVVIGLAWCAPCIAGYGWRYGLGRALRFAASLGAFLAVGLAIGKAKYIRGILTTTVSRSSSQPGMGQSASLVLHAAWHWAGLMIAVALAGMLLMVLTRRGPLAAMGMLLLLAAVAAPLNQARIGTSVSLNKHVVFGAWFGCIAAGYALSRLLRYRVLVGLAATALILVVPLLYTGQASALYEGWPAENPAFITALRSLVRPGTQEYLIEGYSDIPAYYVGPSIHSIQWKDEIDFSYTDPKTKVIYKNLPAIADAVRLRTFNLIILNFARSEDYAIVSDIARYGGYRFVEHLPPSDSGSNRYYTVWRRF